MSDIETLDERTVEACAAALEAVVKKRRKEKIKGGNDYILACARYLRGKFISASPTLTRDTTT